MGSLPKDRVVPARAFEKVGVDDCKPFQMKQSSLRRSVTSKGYVAVFVCFTNKRHMLPKEDWTFFENVLHVLDLCGVTGAIRRVLQLKPVYCANPSCAVKVRSSLCSLADLVCLGISN
ncbi:hypothetical protein EVAR_23338_1 [Eumeta japonica]|uniref:Uncharacterized protein n=1 Tax=Eumeta variegata TaxID=151549 RepID=A0A4C1Y0X2_EUMVA|nr:hypothetical protein EVAR_23338_1 [Eumeta japonica]